MVEHVCPWWLGFLIDNPMRRLIHNPEKILRAYIKPGMTVMDVGCGMGLFSIAMAKLVGNDGQVVAVDLQKKMLDHMERRAKKAGVLDQIQGHRCEADDLKINIEADFVLAFTVVHEIPDTQRLLSQIYTCLKPGKRFLIAEPRIHVPARTYQKMLDIAADVGFRQTEQPKVRWCRAVVLEKA